jgi:hypothetical protein
MSLFTAQRITVAFTVVLALATLALVFTAIFQHNDAVKAIDATKRLAIAAENVVAESHQANEISKNSFYTANRPYVMFVAIQPQPITEPSTDASGNVTTKIIQWRLSPTWRNFGKTPAVNILPKICEPIIRPNAVKPVFACTVTEANAGTSVLGPEQQVSAVGTSIDDQTFTDTMSGNKYGIYWVLYHIEMSSCQALVTRRVFVIGCCG